MGEGGAGAFRGFVGQCLRTTRALDALYSPKPFTSRAALEVKNMVQVARCITDAALWRENSVGAHYRSDFAEANRPGWRQHSQLLLVSDQASERQPKERDLVLARQEPVGGRTGGKKAGRS